jgi:succinate dehydrogenase / fumarate reductase flavoprotein subunit
VNLEGNRFVYELETRDVEAAAIIRECTANKRGIVTPTGRLGVWLDTPIIDVMKGPGTIKQSFPAMFRQYDRFGIDITKEPILIYPTQHYQNGGIKMDESGRTTVRGLYAAGETSGGVHGRNRLMGNSLLDILVFGRRAGLHATESVKSMEFGPLSLDHVVKYHEELEKAGIDRERVAPMILPEYRPADVLDKTHSVAF